MELDSPDKAAVHSYYNNSGFTSKAAQYSQVSVKQVESTQTNDYANYELGVL